MKTTRTYKRYRAFKAAIAAAQQRKRGATSPKGRIPHAVLIRRCDHPFAVVGIVGKRWTTIYTPHPDGYKYISYG